MRNVKLPIKLRAGAKCPRYASALASGADLMAHLDAPLEVQPGKTVIVPTGIHLEIPPGYEVQVRPRSGLAAKHGLTVLNAPGTIDADYRGEVKVILIHLGSEPFTIEPDMRIAQMVLCPVVQAEFAKEHGDLAKTVRGSGGFGHTGLQ